MSRCNDKANFSIEAGNGDGSRVTGSITGPWGDFLSKPRRFWENETKHTIGMSKFFCKSTNFPHDVHIGGQGELYCGRNDTKDERSLSKTIHKVSLSRAVNIYINKKQAELYWKSLHKAKNKKIKIIKFAFSIFCAQIM